MSLASGANNYLPSLVLPLLHAAPPHIRRTSALFDHDLGKISWGDVLPRRQFFSMHARPTGASSCIAPQGSAKLDFDPTRSGARVQNIDETDVISRASQHLPAPPSTSQHTQPPSASALSGSSSPSPHAATPAQLNSTWHPIAHTTRFMVLSCTWPPLHSPDTDWPPPHAGMPKLNHMRGQCPPSLPPHIVEKELLIIHPITRSSGRSLNTSGNRHARRLPLQRPTVMGRFP